MKNKLKKRALHDESPSHPIQKNYISNAHSLNVDEK